MKHPDTPIPTTLASSSVKITRRSVPFMSSDSFFLHALHLSDAARGHAIPRPAR